MNQKYYIKMAAKLKKYFKGLLNNSDKDWNEPYQYVRRWEELLQQDNMSKAKQIRFHHDLLKIENEHGSAWAEFVLLVGHWANDN